MLSCPRCGVPYASPVEFCGLDGARLVEAEVDPLIGRTVDRYRIQRGIGDGAMARVYRAEHTYLKHSVALKVLFGEIGGNRHSAERFEREAQAAARIHHENVVSVVDFGVSQEGLTFLAMELLDGPTLAKELKRGPLPQERVIAIARDLAAGLAAAHELGYIHRDLKPGNVMLVERGGKDVAKILDFGLVRSFEDRESTRLTQTGQLFGTPTYMAPEQIGQGDVGPAADLYALGVIMYEMLSGKPPFTGPLSQVLARHLSVPPEPLPPMDGLEALVAKLMEKEPHLRFPNALSVLAALDRITAHRTEPPTEPVTNALTLSDAPATMAPIVIDAMPPPRTALSREQSKTSVIVAIGVAALIVVASTTISMLADERATAKRQARAVTPAGPVAVEDPPTRRVEAPPATTEPVVIKLPVRSAPTRLEATAAPVRKTAKAKPAEDPALDDALAWLEKTMRDGPKVAAAAPKAPAPAPKVDKARLARQRKRLTRGINARLTRRNLSRADGRTMVAGPWRRFEAAKRGDDEKKMVEAYDELSAAIAAIEVTDALVAQRIDATLEALKSVPEDKQDASFRSFEARWISLRESSRNTKSPGDRARVLADVATLQKQLTNAYE